MTTRPQRTLEHLVDDGAVRIGHIGYLNTFPMQWKLPQAAGGADVPAAVSRALVAGEIDAGVISSIEFARHADELVLLPRFGVAAEGAVGSIFLIATTDLSNIRRVHATPASRTSVALAQVLAHMAGRTLEIVELDADPTPTDVVTLTGQGDGVLVIGDHAMGLRGEPLLSQLAFHDLAAAWTGQTELPMVYAVWAIRRDSASFGPALEAAIADSLTAFDEDEPTAIAEAATRWDIDPAAARAYFDQLRFRLGPREHAGLRRFFEEARTAGLLAELPDLSDVDLPTEEPDRRGRAIRELDADERELLERFRAEEEVARARSVDEILTRALAGERIDDLDALALLQSDRLLDIGQVANAIRNRKSDPDVVTFIVDRNINYTNYCVTDCGFCAFYRSPHGDATDGYLLTHDQILRKVQETIDLGGTAALLQGGHNPDLGIEYYVDLFQTIKREFPTFHLHALSPPEIQHISRRSKMTVPDVLSTLRDAGLDSLPGGGAEILVERVRKVLAPKKTKTDAWLGVMRAAHALGMSTSASMMYGHVEMLSERVEHMRRIREVQDEAGGFRAFISWTFQPGDTVLAQRMRRGDVPLAGQLPRTPTPVDYLLTQAVSRIYLDNVPHVQSSWVTQGLKVGQVALDYGADDLGSIMIEENVVSSAGTTFRASVDDFVHAIRAAGKRPVQRDTLYRTVREFD